jgi:uncharacterized protein (TIGR00369 family)
MPHKANPPPGFAVSTIFDGQFADRVGPLFEKPLPDGGCVFGMRVRPDHCNARQTMHGGMMMTLADQVLGLTVDRALENDGLSATVSLNCDLIAAALPGDWVEGEAEVVRKTRSIVFVRGTLRRAESGEVLLSASGLWKRLKG